MPTRREHAHAVSTIVYSVALPWGSFFTCRLQEACHSMRNQNLNELDVAADAASAAEIDAIGPTVVKTRSKEHWCAHRSRYRHRVYIYVCAYACAYAYYLYIAIS